MYFARLEELREDHDMTQQDVADILGCQREVYRRYEKGIRSIPIDFLIILADHYHVSIDYIVGREASPSKPKKTKSCNDEHQM